MDTERERGGRDVEEAEVQRAAVHEGNVGTRPHPGSDRRGHSDAGRQRDAAAGHAVVTLHWTVPQLRAELGEVAVSHQRSSRSTSRSFDCGLAGFIGLAVS